MPEYINGQMTYNGSDGQPISYGTQYGNGARGPSTVIDDKYGYVDPNSRNVTGTGTFKDQFKKEWLIRDSLIEAAKEQVFQKLGTVINLAPNNGKYIMQYVWHPLLDDRNVNDQGIDANGVYYANGNMYGSSKDIATIQGKLPKLGENGGRYNRVGFSRTMIEGTIQKVGFFFEFTKDALQFDSQEDLLQHMHREAMRGASKIVEDAMQIDLINGAGLNAFAGTATSNDTLADVPDYKFWLKLSRDLVDNEVKKHYKMFTGSQNTDTRTVGGGWTVYCPPEFRTTLMMTKDLHDRPAFIPVEQYAAGGNTVENEIGKILDFRFVEVKDMLRWENEGPAASDDYINNGTKNTVFPLLIIDDESFVSIGFRSGGAKQNFEIIQKMPGAETADAHHDPYGEHGFWSIKWWYGTMIRRPERLCCIHTLALA